MDRQRVLIFIVLASGLLVIAGIIWWLWPHSTTTPPPAVNAAVEPIDQKTFLDISAGLVVFLSTSETGKTVYATDTASTASLALSDQSQELLSNYLLATNHWYGVTNGVMSLHESSGTRTIGQLSIQPQAIAVDSAELYVAWFSNEQLHLYTIATAEDKIIYTGTTGALYDQLVFAPDGSEMAFVENSQKIISVDLAGAELYNSISLPFYEFHSLSWITANEFGLVVTSATQNPEPFSPYVLVLQRDGTKAEEHKILDRVGVPVVVWSTDGSQWLFFHPWRNTWLAYNRFNQITQEVPAKTAGKLTAFAYQPSYSSLPVTIEPDIPSTPTTTGTFTTTADEWDNYNNTIRNIVAKLKIDLKTYRFTTTDQGLYVEFVYKPPVETTFLDTLKTIFATFPDVPTVTLVIKDDTGNVIWRVDNAIKTNLTDQGNNYIQLAKLGAIQPTRKFFSTDLFTVLHPSNLTGKILPDGTIVFYSTETTFLSSTAWTGYSITLKPYSAPGITLNQWLSVNRPDGMITNSINAEAALLHNNTVYLFTVQRDAGLKETDKTDLQSMADSLSFYDNN
ncbi:MAG: hypothetical protein WCV88_02680 [Patescibacteria group bacterium]|jgi:hypothetical protein